MTTTMRPLQLLKGGVIATFYTYYQASFNKYFQTCILSKGFQAISFPLKLALCIKFEAYLISQKEELKEAFTVSTSN